MNPTNAIEVKNITKSFKIYPDKANTMKDKMLFLNRSRYEMRPVLRGISFDVKKGEAIGLIGHNGCGKSTTLKLLTRIMYPDNGTIEMKGRVSSLIELGAGFHPDMSGIDNIYINAAIFGLNRKEIDARLASIIEFSELEEFINNPVRTYSSGMYMRLAFSVAINVDADILLIDEILAVGDAAFQAKCFNKLRDIKARGTTIVIVSHALGQIEQICERSIWIHDGLIRDEGPPRIVDPIYMQFMSERVNTPLKKPEAVIDEGTAEDTAAGEERASEAHDTCEENTDDNVDSTPNDNSTSPDDGKRFGSREVYIDKITVVDSEGCERSSFAPDEKISIRIDYAGEHAISDVVIGVAIYRSDETHIYGCNTLVDSSMSYDLGEKGTITLDIDRLPLITGTYHIDLALHKADGFNYDFWREAVSVQIANPINETGIVSLRHEWYVE